MGIETNFGKYLGKMDIISSLATLSFDKRSRNIKRDFGGQGFDVGGGKMNTPIGKIFNLNSPNVGPKYES